MQQSPNFGGLGLVGYAIFWGHKIGSATKCQSQNHPHPFTSLMHTYIRFNIGLINNKDKWNYLVDEQALQ